MTMPASVAGWSLIIRRTCAITAVHAATPICSMTRLVARLPEWTIEASPPPRTNRKSTGCTNEDRMRARSRRNRIISRCHTTVAALSWCSTPPDGTRTDATEVDAAVIIAS